MLTNDVFKVPRKNGSRAFNSFMLNPFSNQTSPPPKHCLEALVALAHTSGDKTAVAAHDADWTYRDLVTQAVGASQILLRKGGVVRFPPDTVIPLIASPSARGLVALLGIQYAGAAYLPIDPAYPRSRIEAMALPTHPPIAIVEDSFASELAFLASVGIPVLTLTELFAEADKRKRNSELAAFSPAAISPKDLAYVIYTSGSTGSPKGVMIEHSPLVHMAYWHAAAFGLNSKSQVLQFASWCFDASVLEIFAALVAGATLHIPNRQAMRPGESLTKTLADRRITFALLPPSVLAITSSHGLDELEVVVSGGEVCSTAIAKSWGNNRRFFNAYGPTENTVTATVGECSASDQGDPPLGYLRPDVSAFIVDVNTELVPQGEAGELYLAGAGLARGYWGDGERTRTSFLEKSWGPGGESIRVYRTGDLVRARSDGSLVFIGRLDRQVKVRGHRVELEEIERQLAVAPNVQECAVVFEPASEQVPGGRLHAFAAFDSGANHPSTALLSELRNSLENKLPGFMIPQMHAITALPRNDREKVDFAALLKLAIEPNQVDGPNGHEQKVRGERPATDETKEINEPGGELSTLERELLVVWRTTLRDPTVGLDDHFVELGGDSLLAVRLTVVAAQRGISVPSECVWKYPTVRAMAKELHNGGRPPFREAT